MKNEEFEKLKNSIALKCILKIVVYVILAFFLFALLVDGILNDELANRLSNSNRSLYLWCVGNKRFLMTIFGGTICLGIAFVVIRNANQHMVKIIEAMDLILKEPEKEVKLPNDLLILENRLNNLRVDLVTNQQKAKDALQKKNDLMMYMAHDLKTPLTSIIGYLTLLTDEKEIPPHLQEKYSQIALKKAFRVEELINQFFDITRYDWQNMPITKQKIDLTFLLEQLIEEAYPMLQEKSLMCTFQRTQTIEFLGDGDKLARAFGNLLKNAITYSYEGTEIIIQAKQEADKIEIVFQNKGDKIPEAQLSRLFEKFYRADASRTSSTGGAGLGLAITKQIIELHGGNITVSNEDEWISFLVVLKLDKLT